MRRSNDKLGISGVQDNPKVSHNLASKQTSPNKKHNGNTALSNGSSKVTSGSFFGLRKMMSHSQADSDADTISISSGATSGSRKAKRQNSMSSLNSKASTIIPSSQVTNSAHSRQASTYSISTVQSSYDHKASRTNNGLSRKTTSASIISKPSISLSNNAESLNSGTRGFNLERPESVYEVDRMFRELMEKRDFRSLPAQAKQEMINYTPDKKWMLIYQDALAEYKRQQRVVHNKEANATPEFYTKLLLSKTITASQLKNLWVSLRTEPIDWVRSFIYDCQGDAILSAYLIKVQDLISQDDIDDINDEVFDKEFNTLKALKCMMNQKLGAERVRTDVNLYVNAVAGSLLSPRIVTRKIAAESLTFMIAYYSNYKDGESQNKYHKILNALDNIPNKPFFEFDSNGSSGKKKLIRKPPQNKNYKRFELWLHLVEKTIDGKGKYMSSLVGASEDLKYAMGGNHGTTENHLLEYCLGTMLLINTIVQYGLDYRVRVHLRAQFFAAGLQRLMEKFEGLNYESLSQQCLKFMELAEADELELKSVEEIDENVDFNNPIDLVGALWSKVRNSEAEGFFLSAIQHLYLNQAEKRDNKEELSRSLRLLDELIQNIALVHTTNDESAIGIAMNRLFSSMSTDDMYMKAVQEVKNYKRIAEEANAQKEELSRQLSMGADGLITSLTNEIKEQDSVLFRTRRLNENLAKELEELKRRHLIEKQQQELEMRELLIMLNNNAKFEATKSGSKTSLQIETKNENLVKKLQKQIHEKKAQYRVENRQLGTQIEPSSRLRELRSKMDDIENMARELEMTEFEVYSDTPEEQVEIEEVSDSDNEEHNEELMTQFMEKGPPRPCREDDLEKLDSLRRKLDSLQSESNDIIKFSTSSMFHRQKTLAMERLKELENNYKNFNITFDSEGEVPDVVDPNIKLKIQEELENIENLKLSLVKKLCSLDVKKDKPSSKKSNVLQKLEAQYAEGKGSPAHVGGTPSKSTISSGAAIPFIEELDSNVSGNNGNDNNILNDSSLQMKENPSVSTKSKDHKTEDVGEGLDSSSTPSASTPLTDQASSSLGPPPPPAPPLPPIFSDPGISAAPPPPPPPPPPPLPSKFMGSGSSTAPPPPPLPPSLGSSLAPSASKASDSNVPPPPPPPFPIKKENVPQKTPSVQLDELSDVAKYPRPKKKLKQLHWEKFELDTYNSFWQNSNTDTLASDLMNRGIFEEIESMFAAREIKKLATKKKEEIDKLTFLPRDIAQQYGINLHFYNSLSEEGVILKVLRCEKDVLGNQAVLEFFSRDEITEVTNTLARNFEPYSTNYKIEEISYPEKDPNELQRPDRIYLELIYNLQHYWKSRMRALILITNYEKDYEELMNKLRSIDEAVENIKSSESLKKVFEIILTVGNYMNDNTKQAQGFKLNSLQRLSFIKDDKNSMSFLHYVEKLIRNQFPELLTFLDDLAKCVEISKFSIEGISNDCKDYVNKIKNVQSSIDLGNLSDSSKFHPEDRILKVVLPVIPRSKRKSEFLSDQASHTFNQFDKLMRYFGEDPSDSFVRNSFIDKFSNFVKEFKRVQRDNIKREEEIRIYENRRKLIEAPRNPSGERNMDDDEDETNVMDSLLEKLKSAGSTHSEPSSARKRALIRKQFLERKNPSSDLSASSSAHVVNSPSSEDSLSTTSPSILGSESSPTRLGNEGDAGTRARNLLKELRGANEESVDQAISPSSQFGSDRLRKKLESMNNINEF